MSLPTAEEIIAKIVKFETTNDTIECTVHSLSQVMIEFAKIHVTAALKSACATLPYDDKMNQNILDIMAINKSYPLDKIQ